jgi:dipeptidyl aminopeptidase/acylaminoacyl peptidase
MPDGLEISEVTYIGGGASIPARQYVPAGVQDAAGILLCPGRFRDINGLAFLAEALARKGYVVLATTYRGMDFFTDDEDARAGLDFLTTLPQVNSARIGIVGHSRGGMTGLRTAAQDARVRSLVALAPPTDFPGYVRAMELLSPMRYAGMISSMGGTPEQAPDRYRQVSALEYAAGIHIPVLLVCGTQDLHAPLEHSQRMYDALRQGGNSSCQLEILEGVGHFFEKMYFGYQFEQVAALTVAWFEKTLSKVSDA